MHLCSENKFSYSMAKKLLVKIPKDATREAIDVVEAISVYRPNYVLGLPQEFLKNDSPRSLYVFYHDDWLQKPKISKALAQVNFRPFSETERYFPLIFLENKNNENQMARLDIFKMRIEMERNGGRKFNYITRCISDLIEQEEFLRLPRDDSDSSTHLPAVSFSHK